MLLSDHDVIGKVNPQPVLVSAADLSLWLRTAALLDKMALGVALLDGDAAISDCNVTQVCTLLGLKKWEFGAFRRACSRARLAQLKTRAFCRLNQHANDNGKTRTRSTMVAAE